MAVSELNKVYKQTFKIIEPNVSSFVDKLIKSNTSNNDLISVLPQNLRTQYVAKQFNKNSIREELEQSTKIQSA